MIVCRVPQPIKINGSFLCLPLTNKVFFCRKDFIIHALDFCRKLKHQTFEPLSWSGKNVGLILTVWINLKEWIHLYRLKKFYNLFHNY